MYNVSIVKDKKFKNIYINVRFLTKLNKERVLPIMLLSNILNESCKAYSDKFSVTKVLDNMYGATLNISNSVIGNYHMLIAKTTIIDPIYIKKNNTLLKDAFSLLHEFLLNPLLQDNAFNHAVFEEAKMNLKDAILRNEDDPSTYCMYEAMRKAGINQSLGHGVYGEVEDVDAVTMEEVVRVYYEIIKNAKCNILVLGDVDEKEIDTYVEKYLNFNRNTLDIPCNYCLKNNENGKVYYETKEISQSYITNLYTTEIKNDSSEFASLKVANAILGQLPTSLLFQEIREKHSLCYTIYSALFPYDGVLGISTGVEVGDEDITLTLIAEQIERVKRGEFDDNLIDTAKRMLINSLHSTYDSVDATFGLIYRNILFNKMDTIQELIHDIEVVRKEDIMNVMSKCQLCTSYVLKGEDLQ